MGLSCSGAICGLGWDGLDGLDLCAGLLYEHRFAMLITCQATYRAYKKLSASENKCVVASDSLQTSTLCMATPISTLLVVSFTNPHAFKQSSKKCCTAAPSVRAEQGSCEPISQLKAHMRERDGSKGS